METTKLLLDYHRRMLEDRLRTEAFQRAIAAVVRPGDAVVDVGTGTGVLACFACAAGARRVYAIESGKVLEIARATVAENGYSDRVVFLPRDSRRASPPERVQVVVSETLGGMGVEENIVEIVADARRRFLLPGGRVIPSRVRVFLAPVNVPEVYARHPWPAAERYGLRFTLLRELLTNTPWRIAVEPEALLGPPALLYDLELMAAEQLPETVAVELPAGRDDLCHGFAAWFTADAGEELLVDTSPGQPATHWGHIFLPLAEPLPLKAGGHIALLLRAIPTRNEILFAWSGEVFPNDEAPACAQFVRSNLHLVPPWQGVSLEAKQALAAAARGGGGLLNLLSALTRRA